MRWSHNSEPDVRPENPAEHEPEIDRCLDIVQHLQDLWARAYRDADKYASLTEADEFERQPEIEVKVTCPQCEATVTVIKKWRFGQWQSTLRRAQYIPASAVQFD